MQAYPQQDDLAAFRVPPGVFLKLHQSTWHAGPLFSSMADCSFANLVSWRWPARVLLRHCHG